MGAGGPEGLTTVVRLAAHPETAIAKRLEEIRERKA